jgi:hypothetical protein
MKLLVHIEQYDVVGILPSQLESISLLCNSFGITEAAYIDNTIDGFSGIGGFTRYSSISDFLATESGPYVMFSPTEGEDVRTATIPSDAWLMFGPSMGWNDIINFEDFNTWVKIPVGVLNSRDVVPIALWQLWQGS